MLDVAFGEDDSRVRQGNAAQNLSVLRRMALNMLKRETTSQGGVAAKKRAGWDEDPTLGTGSVKCDCPGAEITEWGSWIPAPYRVRRNVLSLESPWLCECHTGE